MSSADTSNFRWILIPLLHIAHNAQSHIHGDANFTRSYQFVRQFSGYSGATARWAARKFQCLVGLFRTTLWRRSQTVLRQALTTCRIQRLFLSNVNASYLPPVLDGAVDILMRILYWWSHEGLQAFKKSNVRFRLENFVRSYIAWNGWRDLFPSLLRSAPIPRKKQSINVMTLQSLSSGPIPTGPFNNLKGTQPSVVKLSHPSNNKVICVFWSLLGWCRDAGGNYDLMLPLEKQQHDP